VETATYDSGCFFEDGHLADPRSSKTLCYLGVPVDATLYMFGDSGLVATSSTKPDSQLN
jgi:hypothetical protein